MDNEISDMEAIHILLTETPAAGEEWFNALSHAIISNVQLFAIKMALMEIEENIDYWKDKNGKQTVIDFMNIIEKHIKSIR